MASFKVLGVNHLGLAAKDPEKCRWFLKEVLNMSFLGDELVSSQKTLTSMFESSAVATAQTRLEILAAESGTNDGPISKFLEKKGAGIHHLAVTVDSIDSALLKMQEMGIKMVDVVSRPGAHKTKIAFVHPEATGGILLELVEEANS